MKSENFQNFIERLYPGNQLRNITFQVTDDCPCACTYCYQGHKGHNFMSSETGKKIVDLLFQMYDEDDKTKPINKTVKGIILDFIGGEPLMNITAIREISNYFFERCLQENHPWVYHSRISICSNGALYFQKEVQEFFKEFKNFISLTITLDGPREIHDACRVYHNGKGNFNDAYKAYKHFSENYYKINDTKATIAPENLPYLNTIMDFFINLGIENIAANCVFEAEWTEEHAQLFYKQLKILANKLLQHDNFSSTLFDDRLFCPIPPEDNQNYCGGTGAMLAFDPDGIAHPCLRYMKSSLNGDQLPMIIGNADGVYNTKYFKSVKEKLDKITRRSQSTDECFNCPIGAGCAWCSGWNYQLYGTPDKRCTRICIMHKARALANAYYWNKKYRLNNEDKRFKIYLSDEEALKIISEEELALLKELSSK